MYKKARGIDPFHANSIYNHAVLLDGSLKQKQVSLYPLTCERASTAKFIFPEKILCPIQRHRKADFPAVGGII